MDDAAHDLEIVWHQAVHHYGTTVPADALEPASIAVTVDVPSFPRRDAIAGERFLEPIEAPIEPPETA